MNSVINLQQKIKYLLKHHKVVVLQSCSSDWQNAFVEGLTADRKVVDISDPMLRERAMWNPEEFVRNLPKPVLLSNLQYVPNLLASLVSSDAPVGSYLCVVGQSYYIKEESCNLGGVAFLDLPLCIEGKEPFYPCTDFLKNLQERDASFNFPAKILQGKLSKNAFT